MPVSPSPRASQLLRQLGLALVTLSAPLPLLAQKAAAPSPRIAEVERRVPLVMPRVIEWRRDIHEHPELSGEEKRTSALVAEHLKKLGIEVRTGVGGYGVKPGKVVALRADMDGLPVEELVDLPFKSKVRGIYRGQPVGVMHACGHDTHVAMLMGVAEVLAGMKDQIPGTVKFIFQPAEEGLADGKTGAVEMIKDGVLANPKVDAIFGMHVGNGPAGRSGHGGIECVHDHRARTSDAWRHAVGRCRSDRHRRADRHRHPDHREPADRCE